MSYFKRGKSYVVVVNVRDASGKRQQIRKTAPDKDAAKILEGQLLSKRETGSDLRPEKISVKEYLDRWIENRAPNLRETTTERYRQLLRYVCDEVGSVRLQKLTPFQIAGVYAALRKRGLSQKTALNCHRVLAKALKDAVRQDLIDRSPTDRVEAPRPVKFYPRVPSADEVARILEVTDRPTYATLFRLAAWTGMRLGEILGLRWTDVDLVGQRLFVRQVRTQDGRIGQPKTYRSQRAISLSSATVDVLEQHRRRQREERLAAGPAYAEGDYVFADALGRPLTHGRVDHVWHRIVKKAKVEGVRFHDLRHFHATALLGAGHSLNVVQERLGHSLASTTLNIYAHTLPGQDTAAAAELDRVLASAT